MHGRNQLNYNPISTNNQIIHFFSSDDKSRVLGELTETIVFTSEKEKNKESISKKERQARPDLLYPHFPMLRWMYSTPHPLNSIGQLIMSYCSPKDFERWSTTVLDEKTSDDLREMKVSSEKALVPSWSHVLGEFTKNYFDHYGIVENNLTVSALVGIYNRLAEPRRERMLGFICDYADSKDHIISQTVKNRAWFFSLSSNSEDFLLFSKFSDSNKAKMLPYLIGAGLFENASTKYLSWKKRVEFYDDLDYRDFLPCLNNSIILDIFSLNSLHCLTCYTSLCLTGSCMHNNYDCTVCYCYRFPTVTPVLWTPVLASSLWIGPITTNIMIDAFPEQLETTLKAFNVIISQEDNFYYYLEKNMEYIREYCWGIKKENVLIAKKELIEKLNKVIDYLFERIARLTTKQQCMELFETNINQFFQNSASVTPSCRMFCQSLPYSPKKIAFIEAIQAKLLTFIPTSHLQALEKMLNHQVFAEAHIRFGVKSQLRSQLIEEIEHLKGDPVKSSYNFPDTKVKESLSMVVFER